MVALILIKVWFSFVVLTFFQGCPTSDLLETVYVDNVEHHMNESVNNPTQVDSS